VKLNDELIVGLIVRLIVGLIVRLIVGLFSRLGVEFSEMEFDVADELLHVS
jgi:hypothetical protein